MIIRGRNVRVLGFRGFVNSVDVLLSKISSFNFGSSVVQLLDADGICSENHVYHAINQALLSFERGENLANNLGVEIILRCSAQRQISKAFELLGLKEGNMNLCGVFIDCPDKFVDDLSSIFEVDCGVFVGDDLVLKEIYEISDMMVDSISIDKLILDKVTRLIVDF